MFPIWTLHPGYRDETYSTAHDPTWFSFTRVQHGVVRSSNQLEFEAISLGNPDDKPVDWLRVFVWAAGRSLFSVTGMKFSIWTWDKILPGYRARAGSLLRSRLTHTFVSFSTPSSICLAHKLERHPLWINFQRVTSSAHKDTGMVHGLRLSCTPTVGGPSQWNGLQFRTVTAHWKVKPETYVRVKVEKARIKSE